MKMFMKIAKIALALSMAAAGAAKAGFIEEPPEGSSLPASAAAVKADPIPVAVVSPADAASQSAPARTRVKRLPPAKK